MWRKTPEQVTCSALTHTVPRCPHTSGHIGLILKGSKMKVCEHAFMFFHRKFSEGENVVEVNSASTLICCFLEPKLGNNLN